MQTLDVGKTGNDGRVQDEGLVPGVQGEVSESW